MLEKKRKTIGQNKFNIRKIAYLALSPNDDIDEQDDS